MTSGGGLRPFLALTGAAAAVLAAALVLAGGLPLAARGALGAEVLVGLVLAAAVLSTGASAALLVRLVARPLERILDAAARLGAPPEPHLPLLGEGGLALPRVALAFERVAGELSEERRRLAAKVEELLAANHALEEARSSLVRSERLATVGRLAAGLAHEVGNPLGAITGYVELARSRLPAGGDPELPAALDRIASAAARIDRAVRDLLDFARPSSPALVPIDLRACVDGALRLARVQARFKGVEVEVAIPEDLPSVLADERHLAQVLLNLFLNAGDAMRGAGRLHVSAAPAATWPDGTPRIRIAVADEGPGFPPGDVARAFEPFFTTKEPGDGTGLGLAISQRIVESFGGVVAAANRPGGGAVLTVDLRASVAAAGERTP